MIFERIIVELYVIKYYINFSLYCKATITEWHGKEHIDII